MSDYYAIEDLQTLHHIAGSPEEAARLTRRRRGQRSAERRRPATLTQQVQGGRVPEDSINMAVRRLLKLKFRAGLFENPYANAEQAAALTNNSEARALARKAAQRTIVLLKNDGMLPLQLPPPGGAKSVIAVIGPSAAVARLGGYYGEPRSRCRSSMAFARWAASQCRLCRGRQTHRQ